MKFNTIQEALEEIRLGRPVVVVDDENRENEGDLVVAAEKITPEMINFMATYARGLICVPMEAARLEELNIYPMVHNKDKDSCNFTVSVDGLTGVSTGISAHDRATTIRSLIDISNDSSEFTRPGHVFPLKAVEGGVLKRLGHTESAVDLTKLAGLYPAGVICEIMNKDGTMARVPELMRFKEKHNIKIIKIDDLVKYRKKTEKLIKKEADTHLPTGSGDFRLVAYTSKLDNYQHLALIKGNVSGKDNVLVRLHSECFTGDILNSLRCDCHHQLDAALNKINEKGEGILLYMRQEGRGIGLINKLKAYGLQDSGFDTVEANEKLGFQADHRDYAISAQILKDLGVNSILLLANNPQKVSELEENGLRITARVPLIVESNCHNKRYLETKKEKMGHLLGEYVS